MTTNCTFNDFQELYFITFSYKFSKNKFVVITNLAKASAYIPVIGAVGSIAAIILISSLGNVSPIDRYLQGLLAIKAIGSILCPFLLPIADAVGTIWRAIYNYKHAKQFEDELLV